jgi:hypothetical protein
MLIYVPDLLIYEIANVLRHKPDVTAQQVRLTRSFLKNFRMFLTSSIFLFSRNCPLSVSMPQTPSSYFPKYQK